MKRFLEIRIWCFIFLLSVIKAPAQTITINEVSPYNSSLEDEEGKSKDWIELYNASEELINLKGWSISDELHEPDKWTFPEENIAPQSFLLLFASGQDRTNPLVYRTVVAVGDSCQYIIPTATTATNWREIAFDDSGWESGVTGLGYGDNDDNTIVANGTKAIFLRQSFEISQPELIEEILFHVDYDDGCVAYLNGVEIARENLPATQGPAPFNSTPFIDREARLHQNGEAVEVVIPNTDGLLKEGKNVLAVQVHNISSNSSDLSILPYLSVSGEEVPNGQVPPVELGLTDAFFHTNFKIKSGETIYLFNAEGTLIDSMAIPTLHTDISFGRFPDGTPQLEVFERATPNGSNQGEGLIGIVAEEVVFSKKSGLYDDQFELVLSGGQEGDIIRYTKNGSDPLPFSNPYNFPITVQENTVIKAAIFRKDHLPSKVQTHSYLLEVVHDLPILSLSFKEDDFFDYLDGIYARGPNSEEEFPHFGANFWEDVEKPIHIDFFEEDRTDGFSANAGVKIFGGWSRGLAQRSLSLFFRSQYGIKTLEYPLFKDRSYINYEALVLRNSGNDWQNTMLRDLTLTGLMENSHVDIQSGHPVVAYLNGAYWGIYNMREKINEHYLSALHDVPTNDISLLEKNGDIIFGDNTEYEQLIDFISTNNLANQFHYEAVKNQVDIANYIQYNIAQIYFDNTDWPGNNIKFWKSKNGKWRWILFDTDFGFGIWNNQNYRNNTLAFALAKFGPAWPNPPWSTLLLRKLMTNEGFQNQFINTFADELNTRFQPSAVKDKIVENANRIRPEMPRHINRWFGTDMQTWQIKINAMRTFADQRLFHMRNFIQEEFNLPEQRNVRIRVEDNSQGSVQLNTLTLTEADWRGIYFQSVPIRLQALPKAGYLFDRWSGDITSTESTVTIDPTKNLTITAHFKRNAAAFLETDIIFNEINYNSNDEQDAGDWVELYNRGSVDQNISNWIFKDGNDEHNFTLPQGTVVPANGYLVLTNSTDKFQQHFPMVQNQIGDFDFKLSSDGELIRLYNASNQLIDSLTYLPDMGWPETANGFGPTLELVNPEMDNAIVDNWATYDFTGTPGALNGVYITSTQLLPVSSITVFPNPVTNDLRISLSLPIRSPVDIELVSITGQQVYYHPNQQFLDNNYSLDLSTLTNGTYWLKVTSKEGVLIQKIIKL